MTKKHFQSIAHALWMTRPTTKRGAALNQWRATRDAVASACAAANGRFDRGRFNRATECESYTPALHGR